MPDENEFPKSLIHGVRVHVIEQQDGTLKLHILTKTSRKVVDCPTDFAEVLARICQQA